MLLFVLPVFAYSSGVTGSSVSGCVPCHGSAESSTVTGDLSATVSEVTPGGAVTLSYRISSTDADHEIGGLDVSASGGTLVAGSGTRISGGELTHVRDQHFASGFASWTFTWTAPTVEGTYTLYSSGLAGDHSHNETGDGYDLDTLVITVDDGCDDLDFDGFEACEDGSGDDCDDSDATVSPDGIETCDGADQDCDGSVDEDPADGAEAWLDADLDGYGDPAVSGFTCLTELPAGWVWNAEDCDDTDASVSPDAEESCDGVDQDCDGVVDGPGSSDVSTFYADRDGDGYGDPDSTSADCQAPSGYVTDTSDCDDTRVEVNPDGIEVCDPLDLDEDCDGVSDDGDADVAGTTTWYADADGDGYGGDNTTPGCVVPDGHVGTTGDCDDADAAFNPGIVESCNEDVDYNCDGATGYEDGDGDGAAACDDCDDNNPAASPGAVETCDNADNDCDGVADEADAVDALLWFVDADQDGYGSAADATLGCETPAGFTDNLDDCDDADPDIRPDTPELWYDGVDQDCDGADDDQDGDGVVLASDCDDTDPTRFPGAIETWYDGVDQDCDGTSDGDADGDGHDAEDYGGDDCDDADAEIYPGAPDTFGDGVVTDCDAADEQDRDGDGYEWDEDCNDSSSAVNPGAREIWYDGLDQDCDGNDQDQDGDGATVSLDCDDTDPARYPGAAESWYDGLDADCDGADDNDADADGFADAGHGGDDCDDADPAVFPGAPDTPGDGVVSDCEPDDEHDQDLDGSEIGEDCDDADATVYPGAVEVWYDGTDQSCDGNDDDQDKDGVDVSLDCDDEDPALLLDCDPASPATDKAVADDCGCDSGGAPTGLLWLGLLAFTRRRSVAR